MQMARTPFQTSGQCVRSVRPPASVVCHPAAGWSLRLWLLPAELNSLSAKSNIHIQENEPSTGKIYHDEKHTLTHTHTHTLTLTLTHTHSHTHTHRASVSEGGPATRFNCNHLPNQWGYLTIHLFAQYKTHHCPTHTHTHTHTKAFRDI